MAEIVAVIGIVGSVAGVAAEGIKLSNTLNSYISQVKYAAKEIQGVTNDVRDTTVVLQQLGDNLKLEEETMSMAP